MAVKSKNDNKAKNKPNNNTVIMVVAGVIIVAAIAIFVSVAGIGGASVTIDYTKIPVTRGADGAFIAGNPDAELTVVVFEDFRCSHCHDYEPTVKQLLKDYVETGKVKYEFRILQTASPDDTIFRIAQCAGEQNANIFFEAREHLFEMISRNGWDAASSPRQFASDLGLDYSKILDCTKDVTQIATDSAIAQQIGVGGTPTLAIREANGSLAIQATTLGTSPSYETLKKYLDSRLGS